MSRAGSDPWWRELGRLDADAIDVRVGLRVGLVVTLPIALGVLVGRPGPGLLASIGALNIALADGAGSYPARVRTLAVACVLNSVSLAAGVLAGFTGWWAVPLLSAWLLGSALLGAAAPVRESVGFCAALTFVVGLGFVAADPAVAVGVFGWSLVGAVWALLAVAVAWPLRPHGPEFRAVARAVEASADALDVVAGAPGRDAVVQAALRARRYVDEARGVVLSALSGRRRPPADARTLLDMTDSLSTLGAVAPALDDAATSADASTGQRTRAAVARTASGLRVVAADLRAERVPAGGAPERVGVGLPPEVYVASAASDRLRAPQPADEPAADPTAPDAARRRTPVERLRAIGADRWRHATRLAVVGGLGFALTRLLGLERGYWVVITVVVVLKPDLSATRRQTALRVGGTLVGSLVGLALIAWIDTDPLLLVCLFATTTGTIALLRANYGFSVAFITPLVLVLLDIGDPAGWQVAEVRVVDTVIGAALGLLGGLLLWRGTERERLDERLSAVYDALGAALAAAGTAHPHEHRATRRQLERALDDAGGSQRRFLAEPAHERGRAAERAEVLGRASAAAVVLPSLGALGDATGGGDDRLLDGCLALARRAWAVAERLDPDDRLRATAEEERRAPTSDDPADLPEAAAAVDPVRRRELLARVDVELTAAERLVAPAIAR